MTFTYRDVDRSDDPVGAAAWMDTFGSWPSVRAYKARSLAWLGDGRPVVDVGCGVGGDIRALGDGAFGVDASSVMLERAHSRGGAFTRSSIYSLPFRSSSLAGVRTDRVLQHVDDPQLALDELVRVLARDGVAVFAEPDQSTLRIDGTDPALTPDVVRYRAEVGIRNGSLAGTLDDELRARDFVAVDRESFAIEITDPALALGLPVWPDVLVDRGWWTRSSAHAFSASLDAAVASGRFRYSFDVVVTYGRRP